MPENPEEPEPPAENLTDIVRRALLEAAEMKELEQRAREVGERAARLTPSPEPPREEGDDPDKK